MSKNLSGKKIYDEVGNTCARRSEGGVDLYFCVDVAIIVLLIALIELEARESDVLDHLEISVQDLVQHQTREIAVEADVSFTNGLDQRVNLFVQNHGTCDDALPTVEDDRVNFTEIFCGVGVTHIHRHPEVDAVFAVDDVEEVGCQLGTKIF